MTDQRLHAPCPMCNETLHAHRPPFGEVWDTLARCPRCGSVSSRPNGEHYCHQRTDDTRLQALKYDSDLRAMTTTQPLIVNSEQAALLRAQGYTDPLTVVDTIPGFVAEPEPERDDPHEDLGYKGRGR